jgi:hypothetical protein
MKQIRRSRTIATFRPVSSAYRTSGGQHTMACTMFLRMAERISGGNTTGEFGGSFSAPDGKNGENESVAFNRTYQPKFCRPSVWSKWNRTDARPNWPAARWWAGRAKQQSQVHTPTTSEKGMLKKCHRIQIDWRNTLRRSYPSQVCLCLDSLFFIRRESQQQIIHYTI